MADDDPTRGDAGDGYRHDGKRVERRSGLERRDDWYVPMRRWKSRNHRVTIAFVFLTLVSTASGFIGYHANQNSNERANQTLRETGAEAVFRSCSARADIRITVAEALDGIRQSAIDPRTPFNKKRAFIARTQGPINRLLTVTLGQRVNITGRVSQKFLDDLRSRSTQRCIDTAKHQFHVNLLDDGHD